MLPKIKCVIIEDEPLAQKGLEEYISKINFLELIGTTSCIAELYEKFEPHQVDLQFLDIEIPQTNGLAYLKMSGNKTQTIVTTAYHSTELAIENQQNIIKILHKPICFEAFLESCIIAQKKILGIIK